MTKLSFIIGLSAIFCPVLLLGQSVKTQSQIESLLQAENSPDLVARVNAFDTLYAIPHAMTEPEVGRAMTKLLKRELDLYHSRTLTGDQEGFADYLGGLGDVVLFYAQHSNDPEPLSLLVQLPANQGSLFSKAMAKFGEKIYPDLENAIANGDFTAKSTSLDILGIQLERDRSGVHPLPNTRAKLRVILGNALKDPDVLIRLIAIDDLEAIGDPNDVPTLQALAATDPVPGLRRRAAEAAVNIPLGRKRY